MNKALTRRAKEYFEVLDELHSKGYVGNEQWQFLSAQEQENTLRMTNRVIEDNLLKNDYSKGSPNEQKKYRILWMKERGIDYESVKNRNLESDPIFSAVSALRKQLNDEAKLRIEEATKRSDEKIVEADDKSLNLQAKLVDMHEKCNELAATHNEVKKKVRTLETDLLQAVKEKVAAEAESRYKEEAFLKSQNQFEDDIASLKDKYDDLVESSEKYSESLHSKYKGEISIIREYCEKQRHDHMLEIENSKVARNKLEKELDKVKDSEKKCIRINIEVTQQLKRSEKEVKHLQKENSILIANLRSSESALAENKGEFKQLKILLNNQKEDSKSINKQLLDYKESVGRLEEQLQHAKEKSKGNKKKVNQKYKE